MPRKANRGRKKKRTSPPETIKIALPFEKAIEGLLSVNPKKKIAKKKPSE
jgi:hypothetical protein